MPMKSTTETAIRTASARIIEPLFEPPLLPPRTM